MAGDDEWIDAPGRIRTDQAAGSDEKGGGGGGGSAPRGHDAAGSDADPDADADADADADGEIDDTLLPVSTAPHSILPVRKSATARSDVPLVGSDPTSGAPELGSDVFVSTAFDGTVLLWDRRAGEGGDAKGLVRRFRPYRGKGGKSAGWCTSVSFVSAAFAKRDLKTDVLVSKPHSRYEHDQNRPAGLLRALTSMWRGTHPLSKSTTSAPRRLSRPCPFPTRLVPSVRSPPSRTGDTSSARVGTMSDCGTSRRRWRRLLLLVQKRRRREPEARECIRGTGGCRSGRRSCRDIMAERSAACVSTIPLPL